MHLLGMQPTDADACTTQVLLPASVGAELMRQEASRNGAQLFELASTSGRSMHAGLPLRPFLPLVCLFPVQSPCTADLLGMLVCRIMCD